MSAISVTFVAAAAYLAGAISIGVFLLYCNWVVVQRGEALRQTARDEEWAP